MATPSFTPSPHKEAIALIRSKRPVAMSVFKRLLPELRGRAFAVTGIEGADALQRIRDAIAALPQGGKEGTWDKVKAQVVEELEGAKFSEEAAQRRATLLIRTHGFQAFQAANWRVAQEDEDTTHLQYLATEDDRVRASHLALNGITLPKNDPFWQKHYPPWEWGCRCRVRPMNPDLVEETRQADANKPPEDRNLLEGPVLEQLRQGTLMRHGQRYDVTPPSDKPGSENAFQWHPDDLRLSLQDLQARYDPETWGDFEKWASNNYATTDVSMLDWLRGRDMVAEDELFSGPETSPRGTTVPVAGDKTRAEFETGISKLAHEEGAAWRKDGGLIEARHGDRFIKWPDAEVAQMEGGVLSHNHPSGLPPTMADYRFAISAGLAEMRIVVKNAVWVIRPPPGGWPGKTRAARDIWWGNIQSELSLALKEKTRDAQAHALVVLVRQTAGADVRLE